jgi:hypothetical protein
MSGLEPRGYADGDLVQKALQLGVQPFGMSDEEIMQAIMQKQQVDDMSGASGDIGKGLSALNENVKDYVFDYTDPLEYATLPFLAPKLAMKGKKVFDAVRGSGGALSKNLRGIGAYIGTDILARDVMGYENPFGKDAQDEAAEDLAEMQDNEFIDFEEDGGIALDIEGMSPEDIAAEIGDKKTPFDKMKGIEAFAKFASQLGTSPGDTPKMTGGEFITIRPFEAPGVMRMANGGIAQFAFGGPAIKKAIAAGVKKGISALDKPIQAIKKEVKAIKEARKTPKASTKKSDSTDLVIYDDAAAAARTTRAPSALDAFPPLLGGTAVAAGKALKSAGESLGRNKAAIGAGLLGYGLPAAGAYGLYKAVTGKDDKPPPPSLKIADGGGDKDVLDADSSLRDFNYAKALERAQAAGRTKPTFVDYVASFPASYTDKLSRDPEFAKQMMAGFVAMMTPTEGFVERNAIADFGGAVLKEQARQEGEVPEQIKLMQAVQENPEILKAMRQLSTATAAADPVADAAQAQAVEQILLNYLYDDKPKKGDKVYDVEGNVLNKNILLKLYRDANGDLTQIKEFIAKK